MAVPRRHRAHLLQAKTHHFLPFEGMPASLGPGLRTVSGANMETRSNVCHRVPIHAMTKDSRFSDLRRRMAAVEQELHERTDNAKAVVPSDAVFTSGQTLDKPKKGATLSHFFQAQDPFQGGAPAPHLIPLS